MPRQFTKHLEVDTEVSFETEDGDVLRGRITAKHRRIVRIVDSRGRQYVTSDKEQGTKILFKSIRAVEMGVFVLDTQLEKQWSSRRRSATFWDEYCHHAQWSFGHERVHSLADLEYILEKRVIPQPVLLFNGHGHNQGGWKLSNGDRLDKKTSLAIHPKNRDKLLLFSSCGIGANRSLCLHLKDIFDARALIGYTGDVGDAMCFLIEPALLQLVMNGDRPAVAVEKVRTAFDAWKGINQKHAKAFPIACHD